MAQQLSIEFHVNVTGVTSAAWDPHFAGAPPDVANYWGRRLEVLLTDAANDHTIGFLTDFVLIAAHTPSNISPIPWYVNQTVTGSYVGSSSYDGIISYTPTVAQALGVNAFGLVLHAGSNVVVVDSMSGTGVSSYATTGVLPMNGPITSVKWRWLNHNVNAGVFDADFALTDFSAVITDTVETHFWNDRVKCSETD